MAYQSLLTLEDGMDVLSQNFGMNWGTVVAQWLRCCATNRKVAGFIPDGVMGIFH